MVDENRLSRLPPDCPVEALGVNAPYSFYCDASGRTRRYHFDDHSRWGILDLFGGSELFLRAHWPLKNSADEIVTFDDFAVARALMATASEKGIISSATLGLENG